jgi:hypothetical protein
MDLSKERDKPTDVPYMCSLSIRVRKGAMLLGDIDILRPMVENLVESVDSDKELVNSIKNDPRASDPSIRVMRQIDIRKKPGDPEILLKCFITWNQSRQIWHVFVEGPDELIFENGELNF